MKLSQMMQSGLSESKSLRGSHVSTLGGIFCCDVLGICLWKLYGESWFTHIDDLEVDFPELKNDVIHPVTSEKLSLYGVLLQLTDTYEWTREDIIKFVEELGC